MTLTRNINGVFARTHCDDPDIIELYTKKGGDRIIVWAAISADILWELKGGLTPKDLENHEYEVLIHFPGGKRKLKV